jgi:hypothetical protein
MIDGNISRASEITDQTEEQMAELGDIFKSTKGPIFCWECGRKLRWPHYVEIEIDGHMRRIHKECKNPKMAELKTKYPLGGNFEME